MTIIISLPFSDTGDEFQYEDILQIAERFNLPVLVDYGYLALVVMLLLTFHTVHHNNYIFLVKKFSCI